MSAVAGLSVPAPYDVYEVNPETVFGFGTDTTFSATRWRFQEE